MNGHLFSREDVMEGTEKKLILIMDDQLLIRRNLAHLLELLGYDTVQVDEGEKAIERISEGFKNRKIDLALIDLSIERGLGGVETIRYLRHNGVELPIIVSSGHIAPESLKELEGMSVDGVLHKPFSVVELKEMLFHVFHSPHEAADPQKQTAESVSLGTIPRNPVLDELSRESMFLFAMDMLPLSIIIFDIHTCEAIFANRTAEQETSDLQSLTVCIGEDFRQNRIDGKTGKVSSVVKLDGRPFGYTTYPIFSDFFIVIYRDITQLEYARNLNRNKILYSEFNRMISRIIHEIGNPLAGIMSILQVAKLNLDNYSKEDILNRFDGALSEIRKLSGILRELRPLGADSAVSPEKICLAELIDSAIKNRSISEWPGTIEIKIPSDLHVFAITEELSFVIEEILSNSQAQLPEGGYIEIREGKRIMSHVEVLIEDNGPGIPPGILEQIFSPFVTGSPENLGLGLTLARKKIIHMGGIIAVQSMESGTRVSILLPLNEVII